MKASSETVKYAMQDVVLDTAIAPESVWTRTGVTLWTGLTPELPQMTASVAGSESQLFISLCLKF